MLGASGFHLNTKNEIFSAAGCRCCQDLKYENFKSPFGSLRQKIALKDSEPMKI